MENSPGLRSLKFPVVSTILHLVVFSWRGSGSLPGVPASNIGGEATDLLGAAGVLVHLGELLCAGLQIGVPAEPATVASINVHDDVGKVEALQSIGDTLLIGALALLAGRQVGVGDQVGERIGLDNESEGGVGVRLDLGDDG